jgi:hypothetical protein
MLPLRAFLLLLSSTLLGVFFWAPAQATEYSSTNFKVSNPVIEELGGRSTSASFQLIGSIPFISPVRTTSTSYINIPGFLGYPGTSTSASSSTSTSFGSFSWVGGPSGSSTDPVLPSKPKPKPTTEIRKRVDFNRDGRVDFIDFSILLYYFDKDGERIIPFDLSDDGTVDVVDLSIFMYYWDGS